MAIGPNPRYLEELRIGGGSGDAVDGGADFEKNGDITTDGNITLKGLLATGSTPHTLTNAAGEIDGAKIQAGSVGAAQLDATDDFSVNDLSVTGDLDVGGSITENGDYQGVSTQDLIALYHFDDASVNMRDWSGNGYGVSAFFDSPTVTTGKYGNALNFDGNDWIRIDAAITTPIKDGDWSMSVWIYPTANGSASQIFGEMGGSGAGSYIGGAGFQFDSTTVYAGLGDAVPNEVKVTKTIALNEWHFLVMTWDESANTMAFYHNGILVGTDTNASLTNTTAGQFRIGGRGAGINNYTGKIDEGAVWNKVLSADEARALYMQRRELIDPLGDQLINGDLHGTGDASFDGGDIDAGIDGGTRGVFTAWDGSSGNAPGCVKICSPNGTAWYLFVEDDGSVKIHSALPTQNSDGTVVGTQT